MALLRIASRKRQKMASLLKNSEEKGTLLYLLNHFRAKSLPPPKNSSNSIGGDLEFFSDVAKTLETETTSMEATTTTTSNNYFGQVLLENDCENSANSIFSSSTEKPKKSS
jgi:hypothetical protein